MATLKVPMEIIDAEGNVEKTLTDFHIIGSVEPGACTMCGRHHLKEEPHDATRMLYQYNFYAEHQRFPTWKDALADCPPQVQEVWERILREKGQWRE